MMVWVLKPRGPVVLKPVTGNASPERKVLK